MTDEQTGLAKKWRDELKASEKFFKDWQERADSVMKRYKDERAVESTVSKYNVLWSNTEIQKPAIYAQLPKPQVERRFLDEDKVGREASEVLQRALSYTIEAYDFDAVCKAIREDYLLPGRCQSRVHYEPTYGDKVPENKRRLEEGESVEGMEYDDDGAYELEEEYTPVVFEEVETRHIHRKDFLHQPARNWNGVGWVAFRESLSRHEGRERFGDAWLKVPMNAQRVTKDDNSDPDTNIKKGDVWEIWDKTSGQVIWIATEGDEAPLDVTPPPLDLKGFFPCPPVLLNIPTNDSLEPTPEYTMYQDQAEELDELSGRIDLIMQGLKVIGVYAGDMKDVMQGVFDKKENSLIPIDDWAMFAERGGLKGAIDWYPVDQVVTVLTQLYQAREAAKQSLYEITGLSDLMRGNVDPREKLGQSQLKAQFGSRRSQEKQNSFSKYIRDLLRLKAEVISEHFSAETLQIMTGQPVSPEVMQVLQDDALRGFKIDIETDSTVAPDQEAEKRSRMEFLEAAGGFLEKALPMAQQVPEMAPLLGQMLLFGIRGFKVSRTMESDFEAAVKAMADAAKQPQEPPPPTPEEITANAKVEKIQADIQKLQVDAKNETDMTGAKIEDMEAGRILEVVSE